MNKKPYTHEELEYLRNNYSNNSSSFIADALNRSLRSVYNQAYNLGLKKTAEFLTSTDSGMFRKGSTIGSEYRFPKGHRPANKGKKMPAEVYAKAAATMFKKGHKPANYKPIGTERITEYGYVEIKIEDPNKWMPKHRLLYEQHYGITIPKGHKCIFLDGNKQNFSIDNLVVESPAMAIQRNTIHRYPEEIKTAIKIHSKLSNTIKKLTHNE